MKSDMGMDAPDTPASERRYDSFQDLTADVESLIDTLWASATREFYISYFHVVEMSKVVILFDSVYLSLLSFSPSFSSHGYIYLTF